MKKFELPQLPYEYNALEPAISRETLQFHHKKHHQSYVDKLNELLTGSGFENASLDEIVKRATGPLFNQAAQHWNHSFLWKSMSPKKTPLLSDGKLAAAITQAFGGMEQFKKEFEEKAKSLFGSGWVWLATDAKGKVQIVPTKDAENPIRQNLTPLFVCDVWEHAYYIDYRNDRPKFLTNFFELIHWSFASDNYIYGQAQVSDSKKQDTATSSKNVSMHK
ncbi:MAG: superoxide dismutase [Bdellovibrionia bacterium]